MAGFSGFYKMLLRHCFRGQIFESNKYKFIAAGLLYFLNELFRTYTKG